MTIQPSPPEPEIVQIPRPFMIKLRLDGSCTIHFRLSEQSIHCHSISFAHEMIRVAVVDMFCEMYRTRWIQRQERERLLSHNIEEIMNDQEKMNELLEDLHRRRQETAAALQKRQEHEEATKDERLPLDAAEEPPAPPKPIVPRPAKKVSHSQQRRSVPQSHWWFDKTWPALKIIGKILIVVVLLAFIGIVVAAFFNEDVNTWMNSIYFGPRQ